MLSLTLDGVAGCDRRRSTRISAEWTGRRPLMRRLPRGRSTVASARRRLLPGAATPRARAARSPCPRAMPSAWRDRRRARVAAAAVGSVIRRSPRRRWGPTSTIGRFSAGAASGVASSRPPLEEAMKSTTPTGRSASWRSPRASWLASIASMARQASPSVRPPPISVRCASVTRAPRVPFVRGHSARTPAVARAPSARARARRSRWLPTDGSLGRRYAWRGRRDPRAAPRRRRFADRADPSRPTIRRSGPFALTSRRGSASAARLRLARRGCPRCADLFLLDPRALRLPGGPRRTARIAEPFSLTPRARRRRAARAARLVRVGSATSPGASAPRPPRGVAWPLAIARAGAVRGLAAVPRDRRRRRAERRSRRPRRSVAPQVPRRVVDGRRRAPFDLVP